MNKRGGHSLRARRAGHDLRQEVFTSSRQEAPRQSRSRAPQQQMLRTTHPEATKRAKAEITGAPVPSPGKDFREGPPRNTHHVALTTEQHEGNGGPATRPRPGPQTVGTKGKTKSQCARTT